MSDCVITAYWTIVKDRSPNIISDKWFYGNGSWSSVAADLSGLVENAGVWRDGIMCLGLVRV